VGRRCQAEGTEPINMDRSDKASDVRNYM
jgi:hypothetical protein